MLRREAGAERAAVVAGTCPRPGPSSPQGRRPPPPPRASAGPWEVTAAAVAAAAVTEYSVRERHRSRRRPPNYAEVTAAVAGLGEFDSDRCRRPLLYDRKFGQGYQRCAVRRRVCRPTDSSR